ncbi:MAG: hypothetical protein JWR39_537 [Devosia sp.]|nr:hypothetical protein [Devosia sp.]
MFISRRIWSMVERCATTRAARRDEHGPLPGTLIRKAADAGLRWAGKIESALQLSHALRRLDCRRAIVVPRGNAFAPSN